MHDRHASRIFVGTLLGSALVVAAGWASGSQRLQAMTAPPVVVKVGKLSAPAPVEWKSEKPNNRLRSYQFRLPGFDGLADAEISIYPESHPSPEKNFPRWQAQFIPPEGQTVEQISRTGVWELPTAKAHYLDIQGTWKYRERPKDPSSKEMIWDNYRVIWVIVAEKEEATHIRFSGPAPVIAKYYPGFEQWIKSLK
jgi:hypothetical protein